LKTEITASCRKDLALLLYKVKAKTSKGISRVVFGVSQGHVLFIGKMRSAYNILIVNRYGRIALERSRCRWGTILKWILKKQYVIMRFGFSRFRITSSSVLFSNVSTLISFAQTNVI
jgi:hypothetical protein